MNMLKAAATGLLLAGAFWGAALSEEVNRLGALDGNGLKYLIRAAKDMEPQTQDKGNEVEDFCTLDESSEAQCGANTEKIAIHWDELVALFRRAAADGSNTVAIPSRENGMTLLSLQRAKGSFGLKLSAIRVDQSDASQFQVPHNKHNPANFEKGSYMYYLLARKEAGAKELQSLAKLALVVYSNEDTDTALRVDFGNYKNVASLRRHGSEHAGTVFVRVKPKGEAIIVDMIVAFAGTKSLADNLSNVKVWKTLGVAASDLDLRVPTGWAEPFAETWRDLVPVIERVRNTCQGIGESECKHGDETCKSMAQVMAGLKGEDLSEEQYALQAQSESTKRPKANCKLRLTLTGHSLGGTQAILGGYSLSRNRDIHKLLYSEENGVRVVTFAAPPVCSGSLCRDKVLTQLGAGNILRVWNPKDPVPDALPGHFYTPVGVDIVLQTPLMESLTPFSAHAMDKYWLDTYDAFEDILKRNAKDEELRKLLPTIQNSNAELLAMRLAFKDTDCGKQLPVSTLLQNDREELGKEVDAKCSAEDKALWHLLEKSRATDLALRRVRVVEEHLKWLLETDGEWRQNLLAFLGAVLKAVTDCGPEFVRSDNYGYSFATLDKVEAMLGTVKSVTSVLENEKGILDSQLFFQLTKGVLEFKSGQRSATLPVVNLRKDEVVKLENGYEYAKVAVHFIGFDDDSVLKNVRRGQRFLLDPIKGKQLISSQFEGSLENMAAAFKLMLSTIKKADVFDVQIEAETGKTVELSKEQMTKLSERKHWLVLKTATQQSWLSLSGYCPYTKAVLQLNPHSEGAPVKTTKGWFAA